MIFRKLYFTILVVLFVAVTFLNAQPYQVRIAFIGNSITYGSGLTNPATESYPAQLQQMLNIRFGDTCFVGNFANPGRTMLKNGDYPIWKEVQMADAWNFAPNICLILMGTNDSKPQNWDKYGEKFFSDYISMIDTFKLRNPHTKFIVCSPPPTYDVVWGIRDSVIFNHVIPNVDSVAKVTGAVQVDFYTPLIDSVSLFPDKIHPGKQGSKVMAEIVLDKLLETDLVHQVETGLTFITSFVSNKKSVPVKDSVLLSWTTINADSVWLDGVLVKGLNSKKVRLNASKTFKLTAKGEKSTDSMKVFVEAYNLVISRLQIDPASKQLNSGDSQNLKLLYFDQKGSRIDTMKTIVWSISEGEGQLINESGNNVTLVAGNSNRIMVLAEAAGLSANAAFRITTTKVEEDLNRPEYIVYPNPVKDKLFIDLNLNSSSTIGFKIFNITGGLVFREEYNVRPGIQKLSIDVNNLQQGLYLYQLTLNNKVVAGRFTKEKE